MDGPWAWYDSARTRRVRIVARSWPHWPPATEDGPLRRDEFARAAFWIGVVAYQTMSILDPAGTPGAGLLDRAWRPLAALLAPVFLLSGQLFDLYLARQPWGGRAWRPWVLRVRFWVGCLPLLGFFVLPAWRWLAGRRPASWAVGGESADLDLVRGRLGFLARGERRLGRLLSLTRPLLWIVAAQAPAVLAGATWLARAGARSGPLHACRAGAFYALHGIVLGGLYHSALGRIARLRLKGWRALSLRVAPVASIVSLPFYLSFFVPFLWVGGSREAKRGDELVTAVHGPLARGGFPPPLYLTKSRRCHSWQARLWSFMKRRLTVDGSATDRHRAALYRWKTFLVWIDAAALGMAGVGGLHPHSALTAGKTAWLLLIGLGFLLQVFALLGRLAGPVGRDLYAQPYGRYFGLSQGALFVGLSCGTLLAAGQAAALGAWLSLVAQLCFLCGLYFLPIAAAARRGLRVGGWCLAFVALGRIGVALRLPRQAAWVLPFLRAIVVLSPLWNLLLAATLGSALLAPFSWRHLQDRQLPVRVRVLLVFLTLTVALPLGGLAIPLWIFAHRRLAGAWSHGDS